MRIPKAIATIFFGITFYTTAAVAVPLHLILESDTPALPGDELLGITYNTLGDLVNFNSAAPSQFFPGNLSSSYSTTGLAFDGSHFILLLESDAPAAPGSELLVVTYNTFGDLINFNAAAPSQFFPGSLSSNFSTTGLAFDGTHYILLLESDMDAGPGNELLLVTYDTIGDLINFNAAAPSQFFPGDLSPNFSTTGLAYHNSQYVLLLESDMDEGPGDELLLITYDTIDDLINFNSAAPSQFFPGDLSSNFSTTGLASTFKGAAVPVPEPTTLALIGFGLAGIGYNRHRRRKAP